MSDTGGVELVPYLGGRDYVHGTTLFNLMTARLSDATDMTFKIARRITGNRVRLEALNATTDDSSRYPCTMTWRRDGRPEGMGVIEHGPADPSLRVPWDETAITRLARVEGTVLRASGLRAHSFIESVVALNKHLLLARLGPAARLLFTRLDVPRLPKSVDALVLTLRGSIENRHFMSALEMDGAAGGRIIFSLAAQP